MRQMLASRREKKAFGIGRTSLGEPSPPRDNIRLAGDPGASPQGLLYYATVCFGAQRKAVIGVTSFRD